MFSCPTCRRNTISLGAKVSASIFKPIECSNCGGLFIVSRGAVLSATVVAMIVAVPLMVADPPIPLATFTLLVLLLAVLGCIYSFGFAPLEQVARAEPEPRWTVTTYVLAATLLAALCLIPAYAIFRL
jgi:hypothetical protein